jgi:hypothetical protein
MNYDRAEHEKDKMASLKTGKKLQKALKVPKIKNSRNLNGTKLVV